VFWFATTTLPESEIERLGPPKEELLRRFSEWSRPIPEFLDSLNPDSVLVTPIYDRHPAATWGRGRVTMLGDAAHATSPTLGQGACLAIESAFALAKHIEAAGHAIPALRSYETERQTRTERIIRLSRQIGAAIQWKQPLACWLRDQLIWATPSRLHLTVLRSIISTGLIPLEPKCA
jgi:2-polyprenyl-6-methoxyphenol hydroxylase-like FAD-dependent oxidoreductase